MKQAPDHLIEQRVALRIAVADHQFDQVGRRPRKDQRRGVVERRGSKQSCLPASLERHLGRRDGIRHEPPRGLSESREIGTGG